MTASGPGPREEKEGACSHIFRRAHPCFIRTIRMAEGRCVAQKVLFTEVVLQSISPMSSQQPAKEVARLSQKWKNKSFRYTKLKF